jgi:predicted metal-dependent hydrolase
LDFEDAAAVGAGLKSEHIKAFGAGALAGRAEQKHSRAMLLPGTGATRCRLFHSKVTLAALEHMTATINEWLDRSDIEIKHVSEVIGVMEGKKAEPNLIVIVWY